MPANLDDPASPTIYRTSGEPPYPGPDNPAIPSVVVPRQVTLRDRQTVATIVPFTSRDQLPPSLGVYLCDQLNKEIDGGDTYPMIERFTPDSFTSYWFQNFGAVMLLGEISGPEQVIEGKDWSKECLGSFYIKPNYPGRSSHVCNAGFLVTDASRNRGVGRLMGEAYIHWAPLLGYTYSVFNLVYETNVASCRIWDALGFKRIGRVPGCGNLKSHPGHLVDAIIYGRDLAPGESDEFVSEERFDKIKYYLKYNKYPNGAGRAEKSRLRSAATHYKLTEDDKLMLKDKEVISDPARQYEIAREAHVHQHAGINRTTATIAEKYHWSRIKDMVCDVIRNCGECKDAGKTPVGTQVGTRTFAMDSAATSSMPAATLGSNVATVTTAPAEKPSAEKASTPASGSAHNDNLLAESLLLISALSRQGDGGTGHSPYTDPADLSTLATSEATLHHNPMLQDQPLNHFPSSPSPFTSSSFEQQQPIDPQIIQHSSDHPTPRSPQHHGTVTNPEEHTFDQYHAHLQALLGVNEDDDVVSSSHQQHHHHHHQHDNEDVAAVDRDLEMLIEQHDDDDDRHSNETRMTGVDDEEEDDKRTPPKGSGIYDGGFGSSR